MTDRVYDDLKQLASIRRRWKEVLAIITKRRTAFTLYEWMQVVNLSKMLDINGDEFKGIEDESK